MVSVGTSMADFSMGAGVVLWGDKIYTCSTMSVVTDWDAPTTYGIAAKSFQKDYHFETQNSYELATTKIQSLIYKELFEEYFTYQLREEVLLRVVHLDTLHNQLMGLRFKNAFSHYSPHSYSQSWGFTDGLSAVAVKGDLITGSAVGDFKQILDPKLLLK